MHLKIEFSFYVELKINKNVIYIDIEFPLVQQYNGACCELVHIGQETFNMLLVIMITLPNKMFHI